MTEKRIEEEKQKDGEVRSVRRVQQTRISLSHPDQDKEIIGGMIRLSHTHTHTPECTEPHSGRDVFTCRPSSCSGKVRGEEEIYSGGRFQVLMK